MTSDNPFAEPDDPDRTIFIPKPGGKRVVPLARAALATAPSPLAELDPNTVRPLASPPGPVSGAAPAMVQGPADVSVGGSPLLAAAATLLALLGRIRNTLNPPDPGDLRERAAAELRRFEQAGRDAGIPVEQLRPAHYALCAALDDVALSTPWGAQGAWAAASLVSSFHQQVRSGTEFFTLLQRVSQSPATMLPVLELMYLCLALGFQGQYRLSPRGPAELDKIRDDLYTLIARQRPASEPELSPHWQGVDAGWRPRRAELPLWVAAVCAVAVLAGLYGWALLGLGAASSATAQQALAAPPDHMPAISRAATVAPPPPPVDAGALDRLRGFLKPEIDQKLVAVLGTQAAPVIRTLGGSMFTPGNATVSPESRPLLRRIGTALRSEPGSVTVVGYTDSQPIHTLRFPSNIELSQARAEAAAAVIDDALAQGAPGPAPARVTPEGRGEADAVDSNDTPQGRERNRRIEVILRRQN